MDVFRHYLPVKWRVGRNFLNPLYEDSKASCNVYYDRRSGTYKMKDFGNGDFSGDCFFLVARIKGLDCRNAADFVEVLETIDRELCLGASKGMPPEAVRERRAAIRIAPMAGESEKTQPIGDERQGQNRNGSQDLTGRRNKGSRKRNGNTGAGTGSRKRC